MTTYFFFPETSGMPVETTHTVFRDHWWWPKAYPEILDVHAQPLPPPKEGADIPPPPPKNYTAV